ncbi:MAG: hypothetical protein WC715_02340 [Patescibacteria group bacterium]|jgi:FtsP/CotA-like multicopper oxidase with cupredoxin domain
MELQTKIFLWKIKAARLKRKIKKALKTATQAILILAAVFSLALTPLNQTQGAAAGLNASHDVTAVKERRARKVTQADREAAAAARASSTIENKNQAVPQAVPGGTPDYYNTANYANSPILRKFVDSLPGLGSANANNLGQYISVANPDTVTYPGSDYYEIAVKEYTEKMHSDLPATKLRGYVQLNKGTDANGQNTILPAPIHYMGPTIVATKDRPVRIKFTNMLPTGAGGDLFLPVDTTVMGAGQGPLDASGNSCDPMMAPMPGMPACESYKQNRATLHLHGGRTPWISDGTPHQWITPAGENTVYPKGVSVTNVPDMPDPGPGSMTFFYSNQQSARLLFYHDHSYGITRLNVYAGEAAGYILQDAAEKNLAATGAIPADQIPLIIQDKTFVPDPVSLAATDPTWDTAKWGGKGSLWTPHVYMPNQNPNIPGGVNAFGRWDYGPWIWPPFNMITHQPITLPDGTLIPGTPNNSMGMEAFMDTPVVNGTAYPYANLQPKAYRFRVLNAANDRYMNLQLYVADSAVTAADGRTNTEVKMIPATPGTPVPAYWPPMDGRAGGVPDPASAGPSMIQIGTEGGFLPAPVDIPATPIGWDTDPKSVTVGNVKEHGLLLGPAERADVIIDFSAFAGKTLILYNDAPAALPAGDPRYDYYTGNPNLTSTGGAPSTLAGYGPNTRTVMQIRVAAGTPQAFNPVSLNTAIPAAFAASQDPIIIPQAAYNTAYGKTFADNFGKIADTSMTFTPDGAAAPLNVAFQPKAIIEEWETNYGRMVSNLGVEMPFTNGMNQTSIWYGYLDPATELLKDSGTPLSPVAGDGTQIWKITHNGVDTHTIHTHLFDMQLINRVDWVGVIKPPEANELGWKDTLRMNPLEDVVIALRPVAPKQPFGVPDSVRLLDPTMPAGSTMQFRNIDPITGQAPAVTVANNLTNFNWEYVWHCHLLSHEEMDMMRPIQFSVASAAPFAPSGLTAASNGAGVNLSWSDPTPAASATTLGNPANEIGFKVMRAAITGGIPGAYTQIGTALANATSFTDAAAATGNFSYQIVAYNAAGSATSSPANTQVTINQTTSALALAPGWNLVTLPIQPVDAQTGQPINYTADSFGVLAGADVVVSWNATTQQYASHVVGLPIGDFSLTNGMGFFVHVAAAKTLSIMGTPFPQITPALSAGWNAVGFNGAAATTAEAYGLSIGANIITKFDSATQQYSSHIIGFPINNFTINPGDGVFAHK